MAAPSTSTVDPKKAPHRALQFRSLDEALAEVNRLVAAERAGRLTCDANWTLGQTLGHLAFWINCPYDGYPPELNPPWFIRVLLRMRKKQFLAGKLPRGVRIPKIPGGTLGIEPLSTDEGLARFQKAAARLKAAPPQAPNIVLGPLTHEEWIKMHLGHAALHLGYMRAG